MNKVIHFFCAFTVSALLFSFPLKAAGVITYQEFYDALSPYGIWIEYPGYEHVWHPNEAGFRPYVTNGYWEYTDDGWFWDSGYEWGWAPFHYGSWLYDDNLGWLWIPGYDWAPAWVIWGSVDGYYAWAPIEPGIAIGVESGNWRPHDYYWNMVDRGHIYDRNLSQRLLSADRARAEAGKVTVINNFQNNKEGRGSFAKGPEVNDVEKYTNQKINRVPVREIEKIPENRTANNIHDNKAAESMQGDRTPANTRDNGRTIDVYKPTVQKPEPGQYSRATVKDISPVRSTNVNAKWPSEGSKRQTDNIRSMPVRESRANTMHSAPATHGDRNRR